ncbi:MAG: hypothetical protein [Caudoviricetes sp.]|nr:MAG: hypothetical protein [Caudoviricetes sp.]
MKPLVHYPRDGITYSKGACGSHSVSSTLDWNMVTCPKCKELKEKLDTNSTKAYTYLNKDEKP